MARVAPSERFRAELDEALAGVGQEQDPVETIGRLGARLILQQALEDEMTRFSAGGAGALRRGGLAPQRLRAAQPGRPPARSSSSVRGCVPRRSSASSQRCSDAA